MFCYMSGSCSQWQALYVEALYTIRHRIGQTRDPTSPTDQDLYVFVQNAFGVSLESHERLLAKAYMEKVTITESLSSACELSQKMVEG